MALITYQDKQDFVTNPLADRYKVTAADMNQIKNAINAIETKITSKCKEKIAKVLTNASFSGKNYTDSDLVGLTADTDFFLYADDGGGTLLKVNDGYTFNQTLGRITTDAGNYRLVIFKPITF